MNKTITIGGQEIEIESRAQLIAIIDKVLAENYSEVWIMGHGESSLCAMINPNRAFLVYLRYEGDSGFRSNSKSGDPGKIQQFKLSNGQADEYPEAWLTEREKTKSALLAYFDSGAMDKSVDWVEETSA